MSARSAQMVEDPASVRKVLGSNFGLAVIFPPPIIFGAQLTKQNKKHSGIIE